MQTHSIGSNNGAYAEEGSPIRGALGDDPRLDYLQAAGLRRQRLTAGVDWEEAKRSLMVPIISSVWMLLPA